MFQHKAYFYSSLCANINRLDARCEDLQRCLDEARLKAEIAERQHKTTSLNIPVDKDKPSSYSGVILL